MAINDIVQTIAEARVDARSLSEFVFKPADFMVTRRLAPPINTLQFYVNSLSLSVTEAQGKVEYIETTVQDAINNTAVEGGVLADTFVTATANKVGTVARTQRDKNSDIHSIKDFGAAVGIDSTVAINNALAVGAAFVPEGNYTTTAVVDRSKLFGIGSVNGVKVGFDLNRTKSLFDFGSPVGNDITAVLQTAIAACEIGGEFSGHALIIPPNNYTVTGDITISEPIAIVGEHEFGGGSWAENAPTIRFLSGGFKFSETAGGGYHYMRNLVLHGVRTRAIDLAANEFGNACFKFNEKHSGMFESLVIKGFDVAVGTYKRVGGTWGGAYRYFNYCKFYSNVYSLVQQGYATEMNFISCDFRDRSDKEGLIVIKGTLPEGGGYASASFVTCMFELLGGQSFTDHTKYGIQIYGQSLIKIIGGYLEAAEVYVETGASLVSSAIITSSSARHTGGGFIDIDKAFAHTRKYDLPDLDDGTKWTYSKLTAAVLEVEDTIGCYKFTAIEDAAQFHQISLKGHITGRKSSIKAFPIGSSRAMIQITFEYKAKLGVNIVLTNTLMTQDTWTFTPPDHNHDGWKRHTMVLPFHKGIYKKELYPSFTVRGLSLGDSIFIRDIEVKVLSD